MIGIGRTKRSGEEIERHITQELAEMMPLLGMDGCGVELNSFDEATGIALIHFVGECTHCEASAVTFMPGIETRLKLKVAELQEIRLEKGPR